jgi:3-oxoacyl-[acyl-carrier-protein] synthase-3
MFLSGPRYVLGDVAVDHGELPTVCDRIAELRIPPRADFWGWGTVHRAARTTADMAIDTALATMRDADIDASSVDALVLCSTQFPADTADHGTFVQAVMGKLGLDDIEFVGVALNQCANLLAGVRAAEAMVAGGRHRCVLVITTDRVEDERTRMQPFALFSDGAASCVVSATPRGRPVFVLLGSAVATDVRELGWAHELSANLAQRVNERLLPPHGLTEGDLDAVLHANVFKPIVMLKELQAGFRADQLDARNIPRVGHCFAADPIINIADRYSAGELRPGGHYLLASSVPGVRIGVLLQGPAVVA